MAPLLIASLAAAMFAGAGPVAAGERTTDGSPLMRLAGNTSSNSSSNTSSNSSAGGSSYIHTHRWSVQSDDGGRRRHIGGTTRIERFRPAPERGRKIYRERFQQDDD